MKKSIQLLAALSLVLFSASAFAADSGVTATGVGEVWAQPDRATVNMAAVAVNDHLKEARTHVNQVTNQVLSITEALDIPDKRINTAQPSIVPQYTYNEDTDERKLTGYRVERQITVRLQHLSNLEQLIKQSVEAGVSRVSPPVLRSSKAQQLRHQALESAARNARANAQAMAHALGARLGDVLHLNASRIRHQPQRRTYAMAAARVEQSDQSNFETGQIRVKVRVTARFDLQQAD